MELVRTNTVVVGASAAGLATAACLGRERVPFVLLEQSGAVGSAWRNHYERLHLHTSKGLSHLPYQRFPRQVARYPSRGDVVAYLESYAADHALAPRFGERVASIRRREDRSWITVTDDARYESENVVVATGYTRHPYTPPLAGLEEFGQVLHSSEYRNGAAWTGRRVLVVGFGNSGGEIALDLLEHGATPAVSIRGAVNIVPRDFLGLPILAWGLALSVLPLALADAIAGIVTRLAIGPFDRLGLRKLPYGPMTQIRRHGRIPLLDVGTVARIRRREIAVRPGIAWFTRGAAHFTDGSEGAYDAVVLATGYRPALPAFLRDAADALDTDGIPRESGRETLPGLYFCGFHVTPTGMLREIGREAVHIARAVHSHGDGA